MEDMICSYPDLDFSPVMTPGVRFAVQCESEDEARHFVSEMIRQFPAKCKNWSDGETRWGEYGDDEGGMAYYPDVNNAENELLSFSGMDYPYVAGYTVVTFSELLSEQNEMQESDMPLGALFEWIRETEVVTHG